MRIRSVRTTATTLAVVVLVVLLLALSGASAAVADQLRDLPSRVDTSPDRMRFVRTGVVVGAVALIVAVGAFLTRGGDDD